VNASEKRKFIRDLTAAVRDDLLKKVKNMPQEWDGIELRQRLADKFANEVFEMTAKRKRAYRSEVATKDL
jgi:hypothetical protein